MPAWLAYLLGAVVAILVALLLAPLIPAPGGHIVEVLAWIVAVVLVILGLVSLIRAPGAPL